MSYGTLRTICLAGLLATVGSVVTRADAQTITIEFPSGGATVISGSGFPPVQSSCLEAVTGGVLSNRVYVGCFGTEGSGSFAYNFNFPPEAAVATHYLWVAYGPSGYPAMLLIGTNPAGAYPRTLTLAALDPSSLAPTVTIKPPVAYVLQGVAGTGLPADSCFVLFVSGVGTNYLCTDATGAFGGGFDVSGAAPSLPRSVELHFDDGSVWTGTETDGAYPRTVALSPTGALTLSAPESGASAVISGAGFPPDCETFLLTALNGAAATPMGAGNTDSFGFWGFNFNYPSEVDTASEFLWEGGGRCSGVVFHGRSAGGPYPRDVFMTRTEASAVVVDVKPGSCRNPLNPASRGVLPVAVLSGPTFDAANVDPTSVRLTGAAPLRARLEDVASPPTEVGGCPGGPDGFLDLVLKFDTQDPALAAALQGWPPHSPIELILTGNLKAEFGGGAVNGSDTVLVVKKHRRGPSGHGPRHRN